MKPSTPPPVSLSAPAHRPAQLRPLPGAGRQFGVREPVSMEGQLAALLAEVRELRREVDALRAEVGRTPRLAKIMAR